MPLKGSALKGGKKSKKPVKKPAMKRAKKQETFESQTPDLFEEVASRGQIVGGDMNNFPQFSANPYDSFYTRLHKLFYHVDPFIVTGPQG